MQPERQPSVQRQRRLRGVLFLSDLRQSLDDVSSERFGMRLLRERERLHGLRAKLSSAAREQRPAVPQRVSWRYAGGLKLPMC